MTAIPKFRYVRSPKLMQAQRMPMHPGAPEPSGFT